MLWLRRLSVIVLIGCFGNRLISGQESPGSVADAPPPMAPKAAIIMAGASAGEGMSFQVFEMGEPGALALGEGGVAALGMPFMGGVQANSASWLQDEDILQELDIVDEQRGQLQKLHDQVAQRRRDFFKTVNELPSEKRFAFIREFSTLLSANVDEQVREILLPHQRRRLEQLQLQTKLRSRGVGAFEGDELIGLLGITDAQKEALQKKRPEVEQQLRKKIEQARKEAQEELLSILTPEQRKKLADLVGEDFEFKPRLPGPFVSGKPPGATTVLGK